MLVLFETPAGYALFKMSDAGKLENPDDLFKFFETPEAANKTVKLKAFSKFENTTDALSAVTAIVEGKVSKNLKKFLSDELSEKDLKDKLAVGDAKLGSAIAKKLGIKVVSDASVNELMRGIRSQLNSLISGLPESDMNAMILGLSHSLSRYKLKFSPDKVDTMIIQAIALLDDLDKELNTYAMRVKEWYGWHFPEMGKIVVDNIAYAKTVKKMGFRTNGAETDFSDILPEELEKELKEAAEVSMGTEISDEDIENVTYLCDQIISIAEYRAQLYDYLKNRMMAIAPNLTVLVGELVGARLIAHAGSLLNLSKAPASTVQILGAEKALFRALKSKHDTPKYGLIYHASLVGQAGPKIKGKIARAVATKAALSVRYDALGESVTADVGIEGRAKVEARLRQLEGKAGRAVIGSAAKAKPNQKKHEFVAASTYNPASDIVMGEATPEKKSKKRKAESDEEEEESSKKEKKEKKDKKKKEANGDAKEANGDGEEKKKKKKRKTEDADGEEAEGKKEKKKKKKEKKAE
ncbi:Nucleolar protein 58 [Rhizophlyctis rosea]|uniref:Nucleolar protein 58 n=1 Tax=Rhizophlyctis rosea TaxID=64517 RepID=A0AAD5SJD3_9FUNG|nr:Nucleolar protein 58 [Rhizophlyctis rosea]